MNDVQKETMSKEELVARRLMDAQPMYIRVTNRDWVVIFNVLKPVGVNKVKVLAHYLGKGKGALRVAHIGNSDYIGETEVSTSGITILEMPVEKGTADQSLLTLQARVTDGTLCIFSVSVFESGGNGENDVFLSYNPVE